MLASDKRNLVGVTVSATRLGMESFMKIDSHRERKLRGVNGEDAMLQRSREE